jgi:hypothetical protein
MFKTLLSAVVILVSLGINKKNVNIGNLEDYVFSLKYGDLEDLCHKTIPRSCVFGTGGRNPISKRLNLSNSWSRANPPN